MADSYRKVLFSRYNLLRVAPFKRKQKIAEVCQNRLTNVTLRLLRRTLTERSTCAIVSPGIDKEAATLSPPPS